MVRLGHRQSQFPLMFAYLRPGEELGQALNFPEMR